MNGSPVEVPFRACHPRVVLLKLTGSSCSGKTTLAYSVAERLQQIAVHDFDEAGVPEHADHRWRHRTTEFWVHRALEYQDRGIDLLLTGQSPLGEVLAAPSSPMLDGIAVLLIDATDDVRRDRLAKRDPGRWDAAAIDAFLGWAAWHRSHAHDPRYRPEVIISDSWPSMAWHRWTDWGPMDPRWCTDLLDTTDQPVARSIDHVERWVTRQREAQRSGRLALTRGWADQPPTNTRHHS